MKNKILTVLSRIVAFMKSHPVVIGLLIAALIFPGLARLVLLITALLFFIPSFMGIGLAKAVNWIKK